MRQYLAVFNATLAEAWVKRRATMLEICVMVVNNAFWLVFFAVFFHQLGEVRGWDRDRIFGLFAMACTAFGLSNGFFSNARRMGRMAYDGELDAALTLPMHPLSYLLARRISAYAVGDVVFGLILHVWVDAGWQQTPVFLVMSVLAAVILTCFMVLLSAAELYFGGRGENAQFGWEISTMFGTYPADIFGGVTKVLLFTVLPTGFITTMPSNVVHDLSWRQALIVFVVAVLSVVAARAAFNAALRRYRSGARWTAA